MPWQKMRQDFLSNLIFLKKLFHSSINDWSKIVYRDGKVLFGTSVRVYLSRLVHTL